MSKRGAVHTPGAPEAIGPYSQGHWAGKLFFSAGQIGLDPESGELVAPGVEPQARRALRNLRAVLEAAGLSMADVVKTTIFLVDMADFAVVNEAYAEAFEAPYPARSTVAVASLPKGGRVEIEVVARRSGGRA